MMRFIILFVACFTVFGCDDNRIFEKNKDLSNKVWLADSIVQFTFDIKDISKPYDLYFNVRNSVSYPYENIYITYYLKDTANSELRSELLNFNLFDPKTGQPYGDGLGDVFDHQFRIIENYRFNRPGLHIMELKQYMRMDSLPEVLSAGILVALAESKE